MIKDPAPPSAAARPAALNEDSFDEFLDDVRPALIRIVLHFRIPEEDAEDLLQEAILHYLRKCDEVRDPHKWLAGALRNECLLYWRHHRRRLYDAVDLAVLDLLGDSGAPQQERTVLVNRLGRMITSLEPRCRSVLELRYRLGCDNEEIADQTGYRPSSVDKIARRCLGALGQRLFGIAVPLGGSRERRRHQEAAT